MLEGESWDPARQAKPLRDHDRAIRALSLDDRKQASERNLWRVRKSFYATELFSSPHELANSSSLRRCSEFNRVGTSTITRASKSPRPRPSMLAMPLPRNLNTWPVWVPSRNPQASPSLRASAPEPRRRARQSEKKSGPRNKDHLHRAETPGAP